MSSTSPNLTAGCDTKCSVGNLNWQMLQVRIVDAIHMNEVYRSTVAEFGLLVLSYSTCTSTGPPDRRPNEFNENTGIFNERLPDAPEV
jgi:hypothetical protein